MVAANNDFRMIVLPAARGMRSFSEASVYCAEALAGKIKQATLACHAKLAGSIARGTKLSFGSSIEIEQRRDFRFWHGRDVPAASTTVRSLRSSGLDADVLG